MCMICGDVGQIQNEVQYTIHLVHMVAAFPITAIFLWQVRNLYRAVKEFIVNVKQKIWGKRN